MTQSLPAKQDGHKSYPDPFIKVYVNEMFIDETHSEQNTQHPKFDAIFKLYNLTDQSVIKLEVWEEDIMGNDHYGDLFIYVNDIIRNDLSGLVRQYYFMQEGFFNVRLTLKLQ